MNCPLTFVIILTLVGINCNAETISVNASTPYRPGKCFYNNKFYPPGEHKLPECTRMICSPNGWVSEHSCVVSSKNKEGCVRGEQKDIDLKFPDCCKREYTCKHEDGSEYIITDF